MKKFITLLLLLVVVPLKVEAANYKITQQLIEANILDDGNMEVTELIVMDGTFNGYEKTINFANSLLNDDYSYDYSSSIYNASGLYLLGIQAKYVNGNLDFTNFDDDDFINLENTVMAQNGDVGKYTSQSFDMGYTYRLYFRSNNQSVAFKIKYQLTKAVVKHLDVAELYWDFIMPNYYDDIENVVIKVNLPQKDETDNFRVWAHGPLSGEIYKNETNTGLIAKIDHLGADELLDIRVTFNKDLIKDGVNVKTTNTKALDKIIEVEEQRANEANILREKLKKKRNFTIMGTITLYIVIIISGIYIYSKYGKSPKSEYYAKYNREFIDDYNVEVIDYLMNRKLTPNAMSASIMNLIYKKNISLEENRLAKDKNYTFILENKDNLNSSELLLVDFLFNRVGNKTNQNNKPIFTTHDLKTYANGTKSCSDFIASYTKWQNDVTKIGKEEAFYEFSGKPKIIGCIIFIISLWMFWYGSANGVDFLPTTLLIFVAFIFLIYALLVFKKTEKGSLHYDKWKAFKNFLDDFGVFEIKELPEIALWERYLVYATIFGLAKKVQKEMNVKIKELNLDNLNTYNSYPSYIYLDLGDYINNSITSAVHSAYNRQSANYANTHSSSSSGGGFGGGFSSGGGFGGGGSSGHGF